MNQRFTSSSSPQTRAHAPLFVTLSQSRHTRSHTRQHVVFYSAVAIIFLLILSPAASSQISVLTQHYDNARTGQNTQETILTHANVNPNQFGLLFSQPIDGQMAAQPLYVPNVFIPSLNATHNVIYAVTMHDGIYAFDADNNQGANAQPLWYVSLLNGAGGVTTVPLVDEKCRVTGYTEFGIQGTPAIDATRNAIYFLAMTKENGSYVHRLHALDLGTGQELFGGPATVSASVVINGETYTFIDRYQQQRPGLLLQNGIVYIGFGSPGCNIKTENGWVMTYDADTLQQVGAFDVSPDVQASAIWQSGAGLTGDDNGNVFFSTGDGLFDGPDGTHFGDTALKLTQVGNTLTLGDYFTPYNQLFFQENDLDLSSSFVTLLPDQPSGQYALAVDKDGTAYILNQNNMGGYNPAGDFQIPQEISVPVDGEVHAGQTYWNNNVYIAAEGTPIMAYSFNDGLLSLQPTSQTPKATANPTGGIVSSNGTQNGIYWHATFPTSKLFAYDATNLANELYDSGMVPARDSIPMVVHFAMPVVANGKVYLNGQTQLSVFGLLPAFTPVAGNHQTGQIGTQLPIALQAGLVDPYTQNPIQQAGIPVTFTVSPRGGSFSNPNTQTDASGTVSTNFTLSKTPGVYTITAASKGYGSAIFTVTATTGMPASMVIASGNNQSATVTTNLKSPLKVKVKDAQGNPVAGITVAFSDNGAGGTLSPATATTDSTGVASTTYTTGTKAGIIAITASTAGVTPVSFKATVLAGPPASMSIYAGNNQTVKAGASTAKQLQVLVEDQYANVAKGAQVTYSDGGAGGSFAPNPATTSSKGIAGSRYTAPMQTGTVTVTATCPGTNNVQFTVNVD